MYTGFLIMSSLHMPIVPDGQVTPGGAAAATGVGDGAAAVVAGADGSAAPEDTALVVVGATAMGARNGSGLLSPAGAATSKGLTAATTGGCVGLAVTAVGDGAVDPGRAGRSRGMISGGGDPTTARAGGGSAALGISSCWPILIL
jgi:hypothetical protein